MGCSLPAAARVVAVRAPYVAVRVPSRRLREGRIAGGESFRAADRARVEEVVAYGTAVTLA